MAGKGPRQDGKQTLLFSAGNELSPQVRDITRRLRAERTDEFSTSSFSTGDGSESWREAWLNSLNGLWTVDEYTRRAALPGETEPSVIKRALFENICFFDALYACAEFEAVERRYGLAAARGEKSAHFTEAAKNEFLPLDANGLPHPAAFGRILTQGTFSDEAIAIARAGKGRKVPDLPQDLRPDVTTVLGVAHPRTAEGAEDERDAPLRNLDKRQIALADKFRDAAQKGADVHEAFKEAVHNKFEKYDYMADVNYGLPILFSVLTLGVLAPLPLAMYAKGVSMPNYRFAKKTLDFNRAAGRLPDSDFKDELTEFSREITLTFDILRVREAYRRRLANAGKEKTQKKLMDVLEAHMREQRRSDAEIAAVKAAMWQDLHGASFEGELKSAMEKRMRNIKAHLAAMERRLARTGAPLPAPAAPLPQLPPPKP
jgi:hypothetical protein